MLFRCVCEWCRGSDWIHIHFFSVKLCPLILVTNDDNSKILRLIPSHSTRIKDLSENSAARLPGHGRGYLLSCLSHASTLSWDSTGNTAALLASFTQKTRRPQTISLWWRGQSTSCVTVVRRGRGRGWLCSLSPTAGAGGVLNGSAVSHCPWDPTGNTRLCCCSPRCAGLSRMLCKYWLDRVAQRLLGVVLGDL